MSETSRQRGPLDDEFEAGYVPCDAPPGISEHEYRRWKEAGGKVDPQAKLQATLDAGTKGRAEMMREVMAEIEAWFLKMEAEMDRRHQERLRQLGRKILPSYIVMGTGIVLMLLSIILRFVGGN